MKTKICKRCNVEKPIDDFVKNKRAKDGLHYLCKCCHRDSGFRYRKHNRDKIRQRNRERYKTKRGHQLKFYDHLRNRYGTMAPMLYDMFFAAQNGKCFFCGKKQSELKNRLAFEHDHKTGELRSLCCPRCNNVIGWAEEFGLNKLSKYLEAA